jgi:aryl-alcohol dehydrogenase-like predicted oxidoreductase
VGVIKQTSRLLTKMEERLLGLTNLPISRIGLGLAALGRPGYMNLGHADDLQRNYDVSAMEAHAYEVLDAAWACGVRYLDAARSYGRAEEFLATWLRARNVHRDAITIGSKWGYTYTAGWQVQAKQHEVKEHSLAVLKRQFQESRSLVGSHLKLYQIHSATLESGVLDNVSVLEELGAIKATGIRIGLTLTGPRQTETLKKAIGITIEGQRLFDVVQATWNLLEPSAGPALQAAHDLGLGVIIKEALANGRLTPRNVDADFEPKRQILANIANQLDTTIDALALAAVLANPWVDVVLSGAATVDQLHSNVKALSVCLPKEAIAQLQTLQETPAHYWHSRSKLPWN